MKNHREKSSNGVVERFRKHTLANIGLAVIVLEIVAVIIIPVIMKLDPITSDFYSLSSPPSLKYLLGTDDVGRDMFARILYGGRVSLFVGFASAVFSALIGIPLGLFAGYYRGVVEMIVMRMADMFMSFPAMVLILVIIAIFNPSIMIVTVVIGILGWTQFAKLVYGNALSIRNQEYVLAARAIGTKNIKIMTQYVLPNAIAPVWITFTFRIAQAIITESALSFLGAGIQPPDASWGNIIYNAQNITVLTQRPWMWIPAGVILMITVVGINFVGDGIRDALDPKTKV